MNAHSVTAYMTLYPYSHDVVYVCDHAYRFEDGNTRASVTCSVAGWAWNPIVTSCGRMLTYSLETSVKY